MTHNATKNLPIYYSANVGIPYWNLHERAFIWGKNGIGALQVTIHGLYYLCTTWQILYPFYHFYSLAKKWYIVLIFIASCLTYIYSIVFLLHKPISVFSICTSIQMKKHRDIIQHVIFSQNLSISQHCFGIFKVIKSIYAKIQNNKESIMQEYNYICSKLENDITISCQNPDSFPISNLHSLVQLSGASLSNQDKHLFLSKCSCEGDTLSGTQVLNALIRNVGEVTIGSYDLIVKMFEIIFQVTQTKLRIGEIFNLFDQYRQFFENDDYDYNKVIISSLSVDGLVAVQSYATVISANICGYPA